MKQIKLLSLILIALFIISCSNDADDNMKADQNPATANQQVTGSANSDFLTSTTYKSVLLEVLYVKGYEPSDQALENFKNFITARCYKPGGITVEKREMASPGQDAYAITDIVDIEDKNRMYFNTDNQIALFAFFVDGHSEEDKEDAVVLGTAYRNTSFVIFENTVQEYSNSPAEPSRVNLESTVIEHEFGHLLGLVNFGTPMQVDHQDTAHGHHCNVDGCLMNYKAEAGRAIDMIGGGIPSLDADCLADLKALGGK
ncbi:membrane metalloprotease [Zhouia sp. PK063]|uniref:membrane metalloprotease n=1 Tax=Zhouia sp. PK063 TaxID=3373602 RepID=UPI0037998A38